MTATLRLILFLGLMLGLSRPGSTHAQAGTDPAQLAAAASGWATQVSAGGGHTCALTATGGVQCWGNNLAGQLGDGTTRTRGAPVDVVGLSQGVVMVSAGNGYTCAVTAAGGVKCWGYNGRGQLGDGTTITRLTPVDVVGLDADIVAVSAGSNHTCALTRVGRVKCWGANGSGQLGDGTTTTRLTPVDVVGLDSGVQMVSAGFRHTCAVTAAGGARCWGYNQGALGDGTWTNRLTPVDVLGLTGGVHTVSTGWDDTCAVLDSGGVKCWGWNKYYPIGREFPRHTPVEVVELGHEVVAVSNGTDLTCALTVSGGVRCWGWNYHGSVGDGTWQNRDRPVEVVGLAADVQALDAGWHYACALSADGSLKCWGKNKDGQLGDGTTSDRPAPVEVWRLIYDCAAVSEIPQNECQALITFFKATNGPLWGNHTGWLRTPTPCNWLGVGCAAGRVRQLSLPANRLVDALPAALGELTALQHLDLSGNDLAGVELPAELGQLAALQTLDLSDNALAGPIPAELGALGRLRSLNLSNNALSGPLPPQLGALTRLQILDLHANALAGPLPAELGALRELHTLDLSSNQLAGPLPAELGRQRALQTLNLSHNALSGAIPPKLGDLGTLRRLDLSYNALDGPLPWTLSQLTALEYLDLGHNQLTGELPAVWSLLPALRHLDLSYNALSGYLPAAYGQLATLQYLDLGHNALYGPLPAAWGGLHQLQVLSLHSNHLAGPIPAAWGALGSAVTYEAPPPPCRWNPWPPPRAPGLWIDLSNNRLSGIVPAGLAEIEGLRVLDIIANQFRGPLPPPLLNRSELCFSAGFNMIDNDPCLGAQVLPPRGAQATYVPPDTVKLSWVYHPKCSYPGHWPVEISMATAPEGPYTILAMVDVYPPEYTVPGLGAGGRYYFWLRHFAPAEQLLESPAERAFDHAYFQQSNLWSDYVTLTLRLAPVQLWLPLVVQ